MSYREALTGDDLACFTNVIGRVSQSRVICSELVIWRLSSWEYFNTQFSDDMAERLADVPEEEIVSPRSSVAGPAMLGLGFALEEPQLKAMYLNLLAAASDSRVQETAHPSFAEVIKQLSAAEAESLAGVLQSPLHLPIIQIRVKAATS